MNDPQAGDFLRLLNRAVQHLAGTSRRASFYVVVAGLVREADTLTSKSNELVLALSEDAFYLNEAVQPHASIEFNGLLREMQARGIESVTLTSPVSLNDLVELAAFIAGQSDDVPAAGTVRLNEAFHAAVDPVEMSGLRRSYASSLDALRSVSGAVTDGSELELGDVAGVVESLLRRSGSEPGASLLLATVHNHDEYTYYHSVNVCLLALALGRLVGLDEDRLRPMGVGALLHDIGKVVIDAAALKRPSELTDEEWSDVRLHPQEGAQAILAACPAGQEVAAVIALEHHVGIDGSGYPDLGGRQPHFFSRLVAVADSYVAMTTHRLHRPARTPQHALQGLLKGAGKRYDPDCVKAFIHMMGIYPPGSVLELDTGEVVMVTHHENGEPGRPAAVLVRDRSGNPLADPEPFSFGKVGVVGQLLPEHAGLQPAALLEQIGLEAGSGS
ncbi:MAG: HD-GYP domain-containing protein [Acidimicrobiia bacterium]